MVKNKELKVCWATFKTVLACSAEAVKSDMFLSPIFSDYPLELHFRQSFVVKRQEEIFKLFFKVEKRSCLIWV